MSFRGPLGNSLRLLLVVAVLPGWAIGDDAAVEFVRDIQPIFAEKCVRCHGDDRQEGGLRLDRRADAQRGGDSGLLLDRAASLLVQRITAAPGERMPPEGEPLSAGQGDMIRRWIDQGTVWPEGVDKVGAAGRYEWWSFQPLRRGAKLQALDGGGWAKSTIDLFILQKLDEQGLLPSPEADRRTLYRRLSFDLLGLPPDPEDVEAFIADTDPLAYEKLVDRMLASPEYGERWARHWLDVVHYGDTHGYDKDKPRPNAWPYRDYVIRSLNADKPYARFVREQIAGDVLWPDDADGITATGFIAAGPWDFIGHAELPESKFDGQLARLMDRDDMVTNTFNTFCSLTVQCARCHNHKFDPVTQTDYYRLQANFAALDRAERHYDAEPQQARLRSELLTREQELQRQQTEIQPEIARHGGAELSELDQRIAAARKNANAAQPAEFGYHSVIEQQPTVAKWVQLDFGEAVDLNRLQLFPCYDDFNNIGAGFGFPLRHKVELSSDSQFEQGVQLLVDETAADVENPGVMPVEAIVDARPARYLRMTATKLAPRMNDFIFALAEIQAFDDAGRNLAAKATVTAIDSIEAPPRWRKSNLIDGLHHGIGKESLMELLPQREQLLERVLDPKLLQAHRRIEAGLRDVGKSLADLPPAQLVYAGMVHTGSGNFIGTGATGGKPRPIHVLKRGDLRTPGEEVGPGIVPLSPAESGNFELPPDHSESDRRVALANWITRPEHPLTWRSIVNRVWQYHFGRGLVDSPNDFGHMGQRPSHPELLDWLAIEFRDHDGSWKHLHRLIVTSAVYRQTSNSHPAAAAIDSQNVWLWRMNRRRLEAEAVRDSVLQLAGKLNDQMTGPAFQDFVVVKPEHSPHYEYRLHDADDPKSHRRSVYRFLVRSQPQPFMTTLDCADPSMQVDKRSETITALQALALLNNKLMLAMSQHLADEVRIRHDNTENQVRDLVRLTFCRSASPEELAELVEYADQHGLENVCRVLFNLNEFVFVD